ncbi:MAG TPA: TonB-dependent receptor, partial [Bacteroidia bacterium]
KVVFYNLKGVSFSNTAQVEFGWEAWKRLNIKTAYRYVDNQTTFSKGLLSKSLVSKHRSFINAGYETRNEKWLFDVTLQWFGAKRLPTTVSNPVEYQRNDYSPSYFNTNAQITYVVKKKNQWNFYLGVENAFNYRQSNPIVSNDKPFGTYFDASMVWGSIYGRMLYGGLRFKIK